MELANVGIDITSDETCLIDLEKFGSTNIGIFDELKPFYRYAFVVTDELRCRSKKFAQQCYKKSYNPVKIKEFHASLIADKHEKNRKLSMQEIRDENECNYYNQGDFCVPRFMNPSTGQYWACFFLLDYCLEMSTKGTNDLFSTSAETRLNEEIKSITTLKKAYDSQSVHYDYETIDHHRTAHVNIPKNLGDVFAGKGIISKDWKQNSKEPSGPKPSIASVAKTEKKCITGAKGSKSDTKGDSKAEPTDEVKSPVVKPKSVSSSLSCWNCVLVFTFHIPTCVIQVFARARANLANRELGALTVPSAMPTVSHAAAPKTAEKPVAVDPDAENAEAEVKVQSHHPTSLIEKHLFDVHRARVPLELTIKDKLILAGRLGRAEACLDIVRNNKNAPKPIARRKKTPQQLPSLSQQPDKDKSCSPSPSREGKSNSSKSSSTRWSPSKGRDEDHAESGRGLIGAKAQSFLQLTMM